MPIHIPAVTSARARPAWSGLRLASLIVLMGLALTPVRAEQGEVVKVDRAQGRISLKHGPLRKFDLPAMTMSYRLADRHWADRVKPGDQVHFEVERIQGYYTITRLNTAP